MENIIKQLEDRIGELTGELKRLTNARAALLSGTQNQNVYYKRGDRAKAIYGVMSKDAAAWPRIIAKKTGLTSRQVARILISSKFVRHIKGKGWILK